MIRPLVLAGSLGDGGSERQLYLWCKYIRDHLEPTVIGFEPAGEYVAVLRELGVRVEVTPLPLDPARRLAQLVRFARQIRPSVVQAQHAFVNPYAVVAAKSIGVPSIGALRTDVGFVSEGLRRWTGPAMRWPDALIGNSRRTLAQAQEMGARESACRYVPNMLEPRTVTPRLDRHDAPIRIGFVGRLVEPKCPLLAAEVFGLVGAVESTAEFVVIGDGPLRAEMQTRIQRSPIAGRVEFLGQLDDPRPEMDRIDVVVVSSRVEGTPNVVLEAFQAGAVVVGTDVGEMGALLADGRGIVCNRGDAGALAAGVLSLMRDRMSRTEMALRCRNYVESEHGVHTVRSRLLEVYNDLSTKGAFRS